MTSSRTTVHPVEDLFLQRWSPRAFDASTIPDADLQTLFDAARWAPSAFNYQPWRLLYAKRESADWQRFLDLLLPFNAGWAQHASALVFILSDTLIVPPGGSEAKPSHSHSFDTGAAWALLALQATRLGYQAHGMTGIDFERVRSELRVPERYRIEAAVAVGRRGDAATLPEALQARERPSDRHPLERFAFAGAFPGA